MLKSNSDLVRVNMNLPRNIVNQVKEYAENLGINTTNAYIYLINQALEQKNMMIQLPTLLNILSGMNITAQQLKEAQEIYDEISQNNDGKEE